MCHNICLFASLSLPPEWHGTDIRSHCDAKRVRGSFFFFFSSCYQITSLKKKKKKCILFIWITVNSLANICQAQSLSSPHLFMFTKPKPLATANTQRSASHQHRYAQEHFHANEQKYSNSYRTCGLLTHTRSHPGVSFHSCLHYHVLLMQTEHFFMHLCIRPVRHVRSDCTQGNFGNVTVSL